MVVVSANKNDEALDRMIKIIQDNYDTDNIGISLYKELMCTARELQVS